MEADYDYIYDQWLLGAWPLVAPQKIFSKSTWHYLYDVL
jgi:hypothetical protein